jgi:hypothetical protein
MNPHPRRWLRQGRPAWRTAAPVRQLGQTRLNRLPRPGTPTKGGDDRPPRSNDPGTPPGLSAPFLEGPPERLDRRGPGPDQVDAGIDPAPDTPPRVPGADTLADADPDGAPRPL